MSVLNSSALNTATLGSGGSGGPEIVYFGGTISAALVGSLQTQPVTVRARIHRPMLLNAWMYERPLRTAYASLYATGYASAAMNARVAYRYKISDTENITLEASMKARVIRSVKLSLASAQTISMAIGGFEFTARDAPDERTCMVSFADRISISGGR